MGIRKRESGGPIGGPLISMRAAADEAGVSTRTIRRWIAAGLLTGYRQGPRLLRIDLEELRDLATPLPTAGYQSGGAA